MNKSLNSADQYYLSAYNAITRLLPLVGFCAALTFTLARLMGFFSFASLPGLISFDAACLFYFGLSHTLVYLYRSTTGAFLSRRIRAVQVVVSLCLLLQWNLITYIFPTRDFWGYAPLFLLLCAFMFKPKTVLINAAGLLVSIAVSWVVKGDLLLPAQNEYFLENLILRVVALLITFTIIYMLTVFADRFLVLSRENAAEMQAQNRKLEGMSRDIIDYTAELIGQRDATSGAHVKRVKEFSRILATSVAEKYPEYGLDGDKVLLISLASSLHDVGKICIPDAILQKPGKLTEEEFEQIKLHTVRGAEMIDLLPDSVEPDFRRCCREICYYHHEKYDGRGYPCGLKGDDIPISAQIVSLVDCYDALTSKRPYKEAIPAAVAARMILNGECGCFSEKLKESFLRCSEGFFKL